VSTVSITTTFTIEACCTCGVQFGITDEHVRELRRSHAWFYCPNGHQQHYTAKSDAELRREAERRAASALEEARRRLAKRTAAGVCPCCNRSFVQLARHMESQHPDHTNKLP
jgi:hypothetical protein